MRGLGRVATTAGAATEAEPELVVSCDHVGLRYASWDTPVLIIILVKLLETLFKHFLYGLLSYLIFLDIQLLA